MATTNSKRVSPEEARRRNRAQDIMRHMFIVHGESHLAVLGMDNQLIAGPSFADSLARLENAADAVRRLRQMGATPQEMREAYEVIRGRA